MKVTPNYKQVETLKSYTVELTPAELGTLTVAMNEIAAELLKKFEVYKQRGSWNTDFKPLDTYDLWCALADAPGNPARKGYDSTWG